jgi:hypothetical protein
MGSLTRSGRQGLAFRTLQPSGFPGWKRLCCTLPIDVAVQSTCWSDSQSLTITAGGAR